MEIAGKYKMIKKIGSGAFGEIYKGKYQFRNQPNYNFSF